MLLFSLRVKIFVLRIISAARNFTIPHITSVEIFNVRKSHIKDLAKATAEQGL